MQQTNYHHRNPYAQPNGAVNGSAIVDGQQNQVSGETSPINGIASAAASGGVGGVDEMAAINAFQAVSVIWLL